jgi:hypothetical protein
VADVLNNVADSIDAAATPPLNLEPSPREEHDTGERLDQLLLICAAMWELLAERAGVTETDLVAKIAEIDARDGIADGKFTYTPVKCPKCNRTLFPKQRRCLYCGAERPVDTVFKTV